jgi:hypothetical protein
MSMQYEDARAILKRRFDGGNVPRALQSKFPILAATPRYQDDGGDDVQQAVQNGTPQAASADFEVAAGNFQPGTYNRWLVPLTYHYSLFRVQGPAMEAAKKKGDKAFLDLLKSETDGAGITEMKCQEMYLTRNGSGMVGQCATTGVTAASTVVTLALTDDIINFDLFEKIHAYNSDVVATATQYVGTARITAINRNPDVGQFTLSNTLGASFNITDANITAGLVYFCRAGDGPQLGSSVIITGDDEWVKGGTAPGTLFSCNRDQDPVGLAGQTYDGATKGYEEAIIDQEALLGYAWGEDEDGANRVCKINTRDLANLKKVAAARMTLDRMKSSVGGLSFQVIKFAGDYGDIKFLSSPFVRRGRNYLGPMNETIFESMGPVPRMLHWNNEQVLTVANADAAEGRLGTYGRYRNRNPMAWVRGLNFGGTA